MKKRQIPYAVMVDDGFESFYATKQQAKKAAAAWRKKQGLKARIQRVPADLLEIARVALGL